ncbi:MAG: hypothetical protein ACXWZ2_14255 [Mycobacterium sp.]
MSFAQSLPPPTQNLGGWHDHQQPYGTVTWTSPQGQRYTTHPGSRLLFHTLCQPTAPITARETPHTTNRGLMMPRRTHTRTHNRTTAINDERRHNQTLIDTETQAAERNKPPPI